MQGLGLQCMPKPCRSMLLDCYSVGMEGFILWGEWRLPLWCEEMRLELSEGELLFFC